MHTFSDFWAANFRLCIAGNMSYGFSYGATNPPIDILSWRRANDVCKKLVKRRELASDQSAFMFDGYCGRRLPGHDCLSVDSTQDMIRLLDRARANSGNGAYARLLSVASIFFMEGPIELARHLIDLSLA
jgi:hypothetical protein